MYFRSPAGIWLKSRAQSGNFAILLLSVYAFFVTDEWEVLVVWADLDQVEELLSESGVTVVHEYIIKIP